MPDYTGKGDIPSDLWSKNLLHLGFPETAKKHSFRKQLRFIQVRLVACALQTKQV